MKKTLPLALCALCAALTCVLAPLAVPVPGTPVPITLATLAVLISGALLGAKYGMLSQAVYLLLGCAGLPVFAGFSGGVGNLLGPTGGYLAGYLVMAWLTGLLYKKLGRRAGAAKKTAVLALSCVAGTVALYALGTAWFMISMKTPLWASLTACVFLYLPGDAVKIALTATLIPQLERALRHTPVKAVLDQ